MSESAEESTFWGKTFGFAARCSPMIGEIALVAGIVSVAKGNSFEEGVAKVRSAHGGLVDKAAEFGDKHNDEITSAVITGVISVASGAVVAAMA
jgi:hypothetical protein